MTLRGILAVLLTASFLHRAAAFAHLLLQALDCRLPQSFLCFDIVDTLLWLRGEAVVDVDCALRELLPKQCHHHTSSGLSQRFRPRSQEVCRKPVEPGMSVEIGGQKVSWMYS